MSLWRPNPDGLHPPSLLAPADRPDSGYRLELFDNCRRDDNGCRPALRRWRSVSYPRVPEQFSWLLVSDAQLDRDWVREPTRPPD